MERIEMKCFTISGGTVTAGIAVQKMKLSGAGVEIDAVIVGEEGRGRALGVLSVQGHPEALMVPCDHSQWSTGYTKTCPDCGLPAGPMRPGDWGQTDKPEHQGEKRGPRPLLLAADVGQTRAGKPKLVREASAAKAADFAVICFRTGMGFRGGNSHTGDRVFSPCRCRGQVEADGLSIRGGCCEKCGIQLPGPPLFKDGDDMPAYKRVGDADWRQVRHPTNSGDEWTFALFPGEIIAEGEIAQGDAGRMGSGRQLVAVMPRGVVFRTGYSGRMYGAPGAHYYLFDGERILSATWDERAASDCF